MLVSAFAGRDPTLKAYEQVIAERYRFFSFGDAGVYQIVGNFMNKIESRHLFTSFLIMEKAIPTRTSNPEANGVLLPNQPCLVI